MTGRSEHNEEDRVYQRALRILSHRDHSIYELRNKLRLREFSDAAIERVLIRLARLDLLDDTRFSETFVREKVRYKPLGRNRLMMELVLKRGVPEDIARSAIRAVLEEEGIEDYDLARSILRKRGAGNRSEIARVLRRRGFDEGTISAVLEERNDGS